MKRNAVGTLIKDIIIIAILGGFAYFVFSSDPSLSSATQKFLAFAVAGIPFGWRWASKLITAVSFKGIFVKLAIAVCLGFIAIFVVLFSDIIRCFTEKSKRAKKEEKSLEEK